MLRVEIYFPSVELSVPKICDVNCSTANILDRGECDLVLRQLARRVGNVSPETQARVKTLSLAQLEELGEALLDFTSLADLEGWLS